MGINIVNELVESKSMEINTVNELVENKSMEISTVNELVEKVLQDNTDAMLSMAKYLLNGGEHPYLDAHRLLTCAAEAGNKEAATLLKLIDWEKRESQFDNATSPKHEEIPALSGDDNTTEETASIPEEDDTTEETANIPEEDNTTEEIASVPEEDSTTEETTNVPEEDDDEDDEEEEEDDDDEDDEEIDQLLRVKLLEAKANYRSWQESEQSDPQDREKAIHLYTEAVEEYENRNKNKPMDNDLIEGLVLIAQYHVEAGNEEEALRFMKLGADNGQKTLAYTYGMHLAKTNREEEAEKYFKQALKGNLTKMHACLALAMLYLQTPGFFQKNKEEAWKYIIKGIELLEKQEKITPECCILYPLKGDYLRRIGKYKEARSAYKVALEKLKDVENLPKELIVVVASSLAELYAKAGKAKLASKYNMLAKKMEKEL